MSPTNRVKLGTALTAIAAVANVSDQLPVSRMYLAILPDVIGMCENSPNYYGTPEQGFTANAKEG